MRLQAAAVMLVALTGVPSCGGSASEGKIGARGGSGGLGVDSGSGATGGSSGAIGSGGSGAAGSGGSAAADGDSGEPSSECRVATQVRLWSGWQNGRGGSNLLKSDGRYLYYNDGSLWRVAVNGGDAEVAEGQDAWVNSFDLDQNQLFLANSSGEIRTGAAASTVLTSGHVATTLAAGSGQLFWSEFDTTNQRSSFFTLPETGGTVMPLGTRASLVVQIKVTKDAMFWTERPDQFTLIPVSLMRAGLDGSAPVVLMPATADFMAFDVSGDTLAIATTHGVSVGPASGGERHELATDTGLHAVVVDGDNVYYARDDACIPMTIGNGQPVCAGKVFRVATSGGSPHELFATEGSPVALGVDAACIYVRSFVGQCHPGCTLALDAAPR